MARNDNVRPDPLNRLARIKIPVPNKDLAKWLKGPRCRAEVEKVTLQIYTYYVNSLPVSELDPKYPGSGLANLKSHADWHVEISGWGVKNDRWFGWVTNDAMSYRPTKGQPYSRVIEYGNRKRNIPAGRHLQRAADIVAGRVSSGEIALSGLSYAPEGRGSTLRGARGRFVANPIRRRPQR